MQLQRGYATHESGVKTLIGLFLCLLVSACANAPQPVADQHQMPPRSTEKWQAVGKIAVTREGQTETANLQWFRQSAATDRVILTGPIGTGATELRREGNRVYWLDDNEQKPLTALPLASDLTRALNTLPLADLGNWLLGYVPNIGMTALERGSWRVEVQSWQLLSEQRLPRKLLLNYEELQIRVVLLDWSVDDK